jgi:hypothetical protein
VALLFLAAAGFFGQCFFCWRGCPVGRSSLIFFLLGVMT